MINNHHKTTTKTPFIKIAGVAPGDNSIEFIAGPEQTVLWMQNGCVHYFKDLPKWRYEICQVQYLSDKIALQQLSKLSISTERQVEIYIYHNYGDIDATPDMINGTLQPSENFRETKNCPSLEWDSKWITIDGIALTKRDLTIIDCIKEDLPDKAIAAKLGITQSTFDFHKRNLYNKVGVNTKTALLTKALLQHV